MQWKLPDNAGVAEWNGGDIASEELSQMDLQVEATAMTVREVLASEGFGNSDIFFGELRFDSFSVFHHIIVFCLVCHRVVASSSSGEFVFDSIPCFSVL